MGLSLYVHKKHIIEYQHIHDVMKNEQEALYDILRKAGVERYNSENYYTYLEISRTNLIEKLNVIKEWDESEFYGLDKCDVLVAFQQIIDKSDPNDEIIYCEWF